MGKALPFIAPRVLKLTYTAWDLQPSAVLKNNEIKQFGEYRTQCIVFAAWDKLEF